MVLDDVPDAFTPSDETMRIRERLDHPIIDADGHLLEYKPHVGDIIRELAGNDAALRYEQTMRTRAQAHPLTREHGVRTSFWAWPARNTIDRATSVLPELLYRRLDEIGIDFAILHPSTGAFALEHPDAEWRQLMARACNTYYARTYSDYRDRLEPVAAIPVGTPEEGIAELDHAIDELHLKAVVMAARVQRTSKLRDGSPINWIDTLGIDSAYDYDPLWNRCVELRVSPGFHGTSHGIGFRTSPTNFVYNSLGSFASAQEAACRSLFMGGVPVRFPKLRFSFLEGGISWAAQLVSDLVSHFEKRNGEAVTLYDPATLDRDLYHALFRAYGGEQFSHETRLVEDLFGSATTRLDEDPSTIDDFAKACVASVDDILRVFEQQYFFGCEADDPLNSLAFSSKMLPKQKKLNAMFGSDIGHWDVPDMRGVLPEAWEMVEKGFATEADFRSFTFTNPVRFLTGNNPRFFEDTIVANQVAAIE